MNIDLEKMWNKTWASIGARGDPHSVFEQMCSMYAEPVRKYHTLDHIQDCFEQLFTHAPMIEDRYTKDVLVISFWGHDIVYDPRATNNEEMSAVWMAHMLGCAGVDNSFVETVCKEYILPSKHLAHPEIKLSFETKLFLDIDLSILGRAPEVFDRYERQIREEYSHVSEAEYILARSNVLCTFLERKPLFFTEPFQECYEAQAKTNLQRSLETLINGT